MQLATCGKCAINMAQGNKNGTISCKAKLLIKSLIFRSHSVGSYMLPLSLLEGLCGTA